MAARSETALPSSAAEVRNADLAYLAEVLDEDFRKLSGQNWKLLNFLLPKQNYCTHE